MKKVVLYIITFYIALISISFAEDTVEDTKAVSLEALSNDLIGKKELVFDAKDLESEKKNDDDGQDEEIIFSEEQRKKEDTSKLCSLTPAIKHDIVSEINTQRSSNLIKKPGSLYYAKGKFILLKGKVLDQNCVPISNAVVRIFQTDSKGFYKDDYINAKKNDAQNINADKENIKDSGEGIKDPNYDPNFQYSGISYTNNLGEFSFITIKPKKISDSNISHINVKVIHPDFTNLETRLYFNDEKDNLKDKELNKIDYESRHKIIAKISQEKYKYFKGGIYNIKFVLFGTNKYKKF